MSRRNRIQVSASGQPRTQHLTMVEGENLPLQTDWNAVQAEDGTTLSNSCWCTDQSNVTLSGAAVAANLSSVSCEATTPGTATIRNEVTFSSGRIAEQLFEVSIRDNRDPA